MGTRETFGNQIRQFSFPHPNYFAVSTGNWLGGSGNLQIMKLDDNGKVTPTYKKENLENSTLFVSRKGMTSTDAPSFLIQEKKGKLFKDINLTLLIRTNNKLREYILPKSPLLNFSTDFEKVLWEELPNNHHLIIGQSSANRLMYSLYACH